MHELLGPKDIVAILPHREPFVFVDAVTELDPGRRVVGEFRVDDTVRFLSRRDEGVFLPGTVLVEAMAQIGAIGVLYPEANRGRAIFFRSIENMVFNERITLGQTVRIVAEAGRMKARLGSMHVTAYVGDNVVATGMLSFALG